MVAATLWVGLCSASTSVAVPSSSEVEGVRQRCEVSEIWKLDNINHWISSGAVIPELVRAIVSTLLPSIVDTSIIVANIGERLKFAVDRAIAGCKHYYVTLNDLLRDRAIPLVPMPPALRGTDSTTIVSRPCTCYRRREYRQKEKKYHI